MEQTKIAIESGKTSLGIEFGSTRIKAVLVDDTNKPIASGSHDWENRLENGIWTYSLEDIWTGLQDCYADMAADVKNKYGVTLTTIGAIGFSAMMHGYMAFNADGELLVPFRTWRNSITGKAAAELTELFNFNIPERWSIAHLYQAVLNGEEHVGNIKYLTTLAGYIHWKLTGEFVLGVGEASGMFPIDSKTRNYNSDMIEKFNSLIAPKGFEWNISDILPKVLIAGDSAGTLTEEGAKLLDPSGNLQAGIPLCPPEGDAGTGMTATNSITKRTGNVSAGTSVFAMVVLEKPLEKAYPEIDIVTTPVGDDVAMVHVNNCTSDINAWVNIFREFAEELGVEISTPKLYDLLYFKALEGDADCGGLISYNYFSGENITHMAEGRPLFVRTPDSKFNLANMMRTHLYSALGTLKLGMDILAKENVEIDKMFGHGGLFKTKDVGQKFMAAAMNTPVSLMETAGEGGAWGIALLASYMRAKDDGETLTDFLNNKVFANGEVYTLSPDADDVNGFNEFAERYSKGLPIEKAAVENMK
ncbi:MAG: FGGY-family carbohydrate kinase [Oscillospiraceae bacterium]|nr:FGGY-family carbohydrate kinase [Oscillospiraceae bacterium]